MTSKKGLLQRLEEGPVICAEGYLFELERRGYLQAGPYVPEVVLEHPEVVEQLHREFLRAGSDAIEAFTYYAHRERMRFVGAEDRIEEINRAALAIAGTVAAEGDALLAGNICNTNLYDPGDKASHAVVRAMFEEQVGWAIDAGVDYIIAETFNWLGEAEIALEVIRSAGAPSVVTLVSIKRDTVRDSDSIGAACRRLEDLGADVVGLNCNRGPATMMPLLAEIRTAVGCQVAGLPAPYRTTPASPSFHNFTDPDCGCLPGETVFPTGLDAFLCNRHEMAAFAETAYDIGVRYLGGCCGTGPHHIRAMAEALGRRPAASRYSPDMSKHFAYGTDPTLNPINTEDDQFQP